MQLLKLVLELGPLAVFFIVRPPGDSGSASPAFVGVITPTPEPSDGTAQPTLPAQTPQITNTPRPTATPTVSPYGEYTIVEGDTLYDIAEANLPAGADLDAMIRRPQPSVLVETGADPI